MLEHWEESGFDMSEPRKLSIFSLNAKPIMEIHFLFI